MRDDITQTYYTFNDVQFLPRFSRVGSRSEVKLDSHFGHFKLTLPIISANMKDITGPKMVVEMFKNGGLGILHRFSNEDTLEKSIDRAVEEFKTALDGVKKVISEGRSRGEYDYISDTRSDATYYVGVSIGVNEADKSRFAALFAAGARLFCIDIAHGHCLKMKNMLEYLRSAYENENVYIIAGNIASVDAAEDLIKWGADVVKVGVGPGCFMAGTMVNTSKGKKPIEEIKVGDSVLTHRGRYKEVTGTATRIEKDNLISVNGEKSTINHEYLVLNKKYSHLVSDENINEYAEWINAGRLTKDYFLLQIKE